MLTGIAIGIIIACGIPAFLSILVQCIGSRGDFFCWDEYFPVGVCIIAVSGAVGFLIGGF